MTPLWGITNWQFWATALEFLAIIWLVWYLPGRWLLRRVLPTQPITAVQRAVSLVVGLVLWTVLAYSCGWLHIRWLLPIIIVGLAGLELWQHQTWKELLAIRFKEFATLFWIIIMGLLIQLPAVVGSGLKTDKGVQFFFTNAQDGMMHLAYIQSLAQHFPPQLPEASGVPLINYHYLGDLATAELNRVFGLPVTYLFFQYLPVVLSVTTGLLLFGLIQAWGGSRRTGYLGLFFWYLGGDLDYLLALILHHDWRWYAAALDNGADQFLNQPQTFAKVIFLAGLWLLTQYWQHRKPWAWWLTVGLFASLIGFKVYFGIFALGALGLATVWRAWKRKSHWQEWLGLIIVGGVSAAIYLPTNHSAGGLSYTPLIWPKLLLGADHLDWRSWLLRQQVYEAKHEWWKVGFLNIVAVGVSLGVIYGTRLIGWAGLHLAWPKNQQVTWAYFWWPMSLLFVFLGLNTMQDPGGVNTYNFLVVTMVPVIIGTAFLVDDWLKKLTWQRGLLIALIVLATVPRSLRNAAAYWQTTFSQHAEATFTPPELEIFTWLAYNTPKDTVLQVHFHSEKATQSSFLAYFSNRTTYLTSTTILETHNLFLPERRKLLQAAMQAADYNGLKELLHGSNISYLYIENLPEQRIMLNRTDMINNIVFSNSAGWVIKL